MPSHLPTSLLRRRLGLTPGQWEPSLFWREYFEGGVNGQSPTTLSTFVAAHNSYTISNSAPITGSLALEWDSGKASIAELCTLDSSSFSILAGINVIVNFPYSIDFVGNYSWFARIEARQGAGSWVYLSLVLLDGGAPASGLLSAAVPASLVGSTALNFRITMVRRSADTGLSKFILDDMEVRNGVLNRIKDSGGNYLKDDSGNYLEGLT